MQDGRLIRHTAPTVAPRARWPDYLIVARIPPGQIWGPRGWKIGPWGSKMDLWDLQIEGPGQSESGSGGSRYLQNWILDGLEGGLEGFGLAWTVILGVQGAVWTPSWGHLGASGGVSGAILEDLGVPNGSGKAIFWIQSGKEQNCRIRCFPICFWRFRS